MLGWGCLSSKKKEKFTVLSVISKREAHVGLCYYGSTRHLWSKTVADMGRGLLFTPTLT
jgi:hypothetical protein